MKKEAAIVGPYSTGLQLQLLRRLRQEDHFKACKSYRVGLKPANPLREIWYQHLKRKRGIQTACLACARSWVGFPAPVRKGEKAEMREGRGTVNRILIQK